MPHSLRVSLIYFAGVLAFLPIVGWVLYLALISPLGSDILNSPVGDVLGLVMAIGYAGIALGSFVGAVIFTVHAVAMNDTFDWSERLMWAAGMLFCTGPIAIPAYWYKEIYEPYRTALTLNTAFASEE